MIDLCEKGKKLYSWWPDWRGRTFVLIASGPSAAECDYNFLNGSDVIVAVIRKNIDLFPQAKILYSADEDWWDHVKGFSKSNSYKITNSRNAANRWKLQRIETKMRDDRLQLKVPGVVGDGGCSGFHLFNLVIQFGAAKIILCGYDMNPSLQSHWYGKNKWERSSNPSSKSYDRWRTALDKASTQAKEAGIKVINVGRESTLLAYPKMKLGEACAA